VNNITYFPNYVRVIQINRDSFVKFEARCNVYVNVSIIIIMSYNTSTIKDYERFSPANFPNAIYELSAINQGISHISIYYKVEIIVSYLKDHRLKTEWIDANPALARMITSGFFKTARLESLFESCRNNKVFLTDFEDYISKQLLTGRN
jgi:hypothetical protein